MSLTVVSLLVRKTLSISFRASKSVTNRIADSRSFTWGSYAIKEYTPIPQEKRFQFTPFPHGKSRRWMKQLTEDEYPEAFELIDQTAKSGDNIGIGEIPTIDRFSILMRKSVALALYDEYTVMRNLVVIKPYHVARQVPTTIAQVLIATRDHPVTKDHLDQLIRIGCELAGREDCGGYTGCIVEVFAYCLLHLQTFRRAGFLVTCVVPMAGQLAGQAGYSMSYIMYKDLQNRIGNSASQIIPDSISFQRPNAKQNPTSDKSTQIVLKETKVLPMTHICKNGKMLKIRPTRMDELPDWYECILGAVDQGFGTNEFPTMDVFIEKRVNNFYNCVAETADTGEVVVYFSIGPSPFSRCLTKNALCMAVLVIRPEYRNQKLYRDMIEVMIKVAAGVGFEHMISTISITNIPAIHCAGCEASGAVGVIPKGIYYKNLGWMELLAVYRNLKLFVKLRDRA